MTDPQPMNRGVNVHRVFSESFNSFEFEMSETDNTRRLISRKQGSDGGIVRRIEVRSRENLAR